MHARRHCCAAKSTKDRSLSSNTYQSLDAARPSAGPRKAVPPFAPHADGDSLIPAVPVSDYAPLARRCAPAAGCDTSAVPPGRSGRPPNEPQPAPPRGVQETIDKATTNRSRFLAEASREHLADLEDVSIAERCLTDIRAGRGASDHGTLSLRFPPRRSVALTEPCTRCSSASGRWPRAFLRRRQQPAPTRMSCSAQQSGNDSDQASSGRPMVESTAATWKRLAPWRRLFLITLPHYLAAAACAVQRRCGRLVRRASREWHAAR